MGAMNAYTTTIVAESTRGKHVALSDNGWNRIQLRQSLATWAAIGGGWRNWRHIRVCRKTDITDMWRFAHKSLRTGEIRTEKSNFQKFGDLAGGSVGVRFDPTKGATHYSGRSNQVKRLMAAGEGGSYFDQIRTGKPDSSLRVLESWMVREGALRASVGFYVKLSRRGG